MKYRCKVCGQIIEVEEGDSCPICGASPDRLEPLEEKEEEKK
jgi:rubrerythrin